MCSNIPETDCQNAVTFFNTVPVQRGTKRHKLCVGTVLRVLENTELPLTHPSIITEYTTVPGLTTFMRNKIKPRKSGQKFHRICIPGQLRPV